MVFCLRPYLFLVGEREKWKDQLLDSFKCKQDKLSDELNTIREVSYDKQRVKIS